MRLHEVQQDLFAPPPPPSRSDSRAARGASCKARRDAGIARARDHAEADLPGWTESAAAFLAAYALSVGGTFLVEQCRDASIGRLPAPDNLKAWGPATTFAIRKGWIRRVGWAPACSSNGSPKGLYIAGEGIR
jgi:hypothetical protein